MFDQISGNWQVRPTFSALHQVAEFPAQPAAGQGEELHTQISLLNVAAPSGILLRGLSAYYVEERAQRAMVGERFGSICRRRHSDPVVPIGGQTDLLAPNRS